MACMDLNYYAGVEIVNIFPTVTKTLIFSVHM